MFNGGSVPVAELSEMNRNDVHVEIVEQPASKGLRFRYECESRTAGAIPGASSTPAYKTYPTIKIHGHNRKAIVIVSCVTKDPPYRPHPYSVIDKEGYKRGGVVSRKVREDTTVTFLHLAIECVRKREIPSALKARAEIKVDPFRTGFSHSNRIATIHLNALRLCFQVYIFDDNTQRYTIPVQPVVSNVIYDKRAVEELTIVKLSDCNCPADGGTKDIIVLCEKVVKEDIKIHFYEVKDNQVVWEGIGYFQPWQVHKQAAIYFKPPPYRNLDITEPVKVAIQLRRPSDVAMSESLPFEYLPLDADYGLHKRKKIEPVSVPEQNRNLQPQCKWNIPLQTPKDKPRDPPQNPAMYGAANQHVFPVGLDVPSSSNFGAHALREECIPSTSSAPVTVQYNDLGRATPVTVQQQNDLGGATPVTVEQNDLGGAAGISSLLNNLDDQQLMHDFNLNSQELASYNVNNLSETFSNVSLTEEQQPINDKMTNSWTLLANSFHLEKMQK